MQPSFSPSQIKKIRVVTLLIVLLILLLIARLIIQSLTFRVVGTNPKATSFAVATTSLSIQFNKALSSTNLRVSSSPNVIQSSHISGKNLILELSQGLNLNKSYRFSIISATSTDGKLIHNYSLTLTPKNIPFNELPASDQQTILKKQAALPYTISSLNYEGTDLLINNGLSSAQVQAYRQAIFSFSNTEKRQFSQVVINPSSVEFAAYNQDSNVNSASFTINIDGTLYDVTLLYSGLTNIELFVSNSLGHQLFDSGMINGSSSS